MRRASRPFCRLTLLCLFFCLAPVLHAAAPDLESGLARQSAPAGESMDDIPLPDEQHPAPAAVTETSVSVPRYSFGGYVQALGILCLAVAGLWFALWLLRRYGKSFRPMRAGRLDRSALCVEAQLPLGPRRGLMVVRFEDERLLLGVTEQRISRLASHPAAGGESAGGGSGGAAKPFAAFLDSFSRDRKGGPEANASRPDGGDHA